MVEKTGFENLQIYQLAEKLADYAWAAIQQWKHLEIDTVGKQLVRSADSVGANIAEGSGSGSTKDNIRFAKIARGSLFETKHWLRQAYKRNLLSDQQVQNFQETLTILTPKLSAYINALTKKTK